jgi:nicotinamide-nucleotide amidase
MKNCDDLINNVGAICKEKRYSLVTSESCTGGGLAYVITKNPDYSFILERGYIVYSLIAKEEVLEVSTHSLQLFGAVSKEVALEMADNALKKSKAHISIAITGIDESAAKECGIVWIACAGIDKKSIAKKIEVKGDRKIFCENTIFASLKILLDFIK